MTARIETLIDADRIADRIEQMGLEIREVFGKEPITLVGVLKGSFVFMADLMRAIPGDVRCEFLGVSSYHGTSSTGVVRITHDLNVSIESKHVLIVEDIVDTGLTLDFLLRTLEVRGPRTLKVAAFLDKPSKRKAEVPVHFTGFSIPDAFVVGYGLDLDERFRGLPYVGVYKPD
jgi:hypoxanthine phosphoribosyltransferase